MNSGWQAFAQPAQPRSATWLVGGLCRCECHPPTDQLMFVPNDALAPVIAMFRNHPVVAANAGFALRGEFVAVAEVRQMGLEGVAGNSGLQQEPCSPCGPRLTNLRHGFRANAVGQNRRPPCSPALCSSCTTSPSTMTGVPRRATPLRAVPRGRALGSGPTAHGLIRRIARSRPPGSLRRLHEQVGEALAVFFL